MKKYIPSVKVNNELKEEVVAELKANIYALEKGKANKSLDSNAVSKIVNQLKDSVNSLENAICTGEENIYAVYDDAKNQLANLKKQENQSLTHRLEEAGEELAYTIVLWKDVIDGVIELDTKEKIEVAKKSRKRVKLDNKLIELEEIKASFVANDERLEKEIKSLEKDLDEYNNSMLNESNERLINDLFRKIKAVNSKIDVLNVRHGNYSACYNLLDMIYTNAKEILEASTFAQDEIDKAKALLSMDKLRNVVVEPDKAIAILKRMDADIKDIAAKTSSMDSKIFGLDSGKTKVSDEALAYKEELMRKAREKESLNKVMNDIDSSDINVVKKNNINLEEK